MAQVQFLKLNQADYQHIMSRAHVYVPLVGLPAAAPLSEAWRAELRELSGYGVLNRTRRTRRRAA